MTIFILKSLLAVRSLHYDFSINLQFSIKKRSIQMNYLFDYDDSFMSNLS